jgi:hypothetical protein
MARPRLSGRVIKGKLPDGFRTIDDALEALPDNGARKLSTHQVKDLRRLYRTGFARTSYVPSSAAAPSRVSKPARTPASDRQLSSTSAEAGLEHGGPLPS